MGTKTIRVELRYSSEADTDKAIRMVARECARTLMASAMLISSGRQPQIAVTSEDIFEGEDQINILEEEEEQAND